MIPERKKLNVHENTFDVFNYGFVESTDLIFGGGDDSSSDDDDDDSLSLVAFDDFVLVDFVAETTGFDEAVVRFFTARFLPVADTARVFLTLT
jgi:hypothetical protein